MEKVAKVYFAPVSDFRNTPAVSEAANHLLKKLIFDFPKVMPLKVHFGERGNSTFLRPENFEGVKAFLRKCGVDTCYMETNVVYKGSRMNTGNHIKIAHEHGFLDLPIIIADDKGFIEIEIDGKYFKKCQIGKSFGEYEGFVVLSHFKGSKITGFGGAIKQLGMGFASKQGKFEQHSDNLPVVNKDVCIQCDLCGQRCPVGAIKFGKINSGCFGCADCLSECPTNAISCDWAGTNFLEKLAEYAYAAAKDKRNVYVNYAGMIAQDCDCKGREFPIVAKDIGVMVSTDAVAIDTAALDLVAHEPFEFGREALKYAEKIGLGSTKYEIEEV